MEVAVRVQDIADIQPIDMWRLTDALSVLRSQSFI